MHMDIMMQNVEKMRNEDPVRFAKLVKNDQQKKQAAFRSGMTGNTEVCGHSFLNRQTQERMPHEIYRT